jgi:hypothetical protein
MSFRLLLSFTLMFAVNLLSAQEPFVENKGQWPSQVHFKVDLPGGSLYMENASLTYDFYDREVIEHHHDGMEQQAQGPLNCHAMKVVYIGANPVEPVVKSSPSLHYYNYFLGSNQASNVHAYQAVQYDELYNGIDLHFHQSSEAMKYDFVVEAGADPTEIKMQYQHADNIELKNDRLWVTTSVNEMMEERPYAYQQKGSRRVEVPCSYNLEDGVITFNFPNGYDKTKELVIDPELIFSSFSGSTANNFGYCATNGSGGELYSGSVVFSLGYPTTTGAYQIAFAGGYVDIAISKFSYDGTTLLYSTYFGGTDTEVPASLWTNDSDELFMLSTVGSSDFPVTSNAYDTTFAGGPSVTVPSYGYSFPNGTDLGVTGFSADGTSLLGSTFVGGTLNEGLQLIESLYYCYGDQVKGRVQGSAFGSIFLSSYSASSDFPTINAAQGTYGGGELDGVLFCLNSDLSTLEWSTFIGGTNADAAFSMDLSGVDIYVTGGTKSNDFPTTGAAVQPNYSGNTDGWLVHYDLMGVLHESTYIGTATFDQSYLVDVAPDGTVDVTGTADASYGVFSSGTVWSTPNGFQYFHKLTATLDSTIMTTQWGDSTTIRPIAFGHNSCGDLVYAGWGGNTMLVNLGVYLPAASSTSGLPVTPDGFQLTTDSNDLYIFSIAADYSALQYATFFGGDIADDHTDGGSSSVDENGNVYLAACAGCGAVDDWPLTPGAWSAVNGSACNLGVAVLKTAGAQARITANTSGAICFGEVLAVQSWSTAVDSFLWDFGDGNTATTSSALHQYNASGVYTVSLIVYEADGCIASDTATMMVAVYPEIQVVAFSDQSICQGGTVLMSATGIGATSFSWTGDSIINGAGTDSIIANPSMDSYYTVVYTNPVGCSATDSVLITVHPIPNPIIIMAGDSLYLNGTYSQYLWFLDGVPVSGGNGPYLIVTEDGNYTVAVTSAFGCVGTSAVQQFILGLDEQFGAFALNVYPNPSQGQIVIEVEGSEIAGNYELALYDESGRLVLTKTVRIATTSSRVSVELGKISVGNYNVVLRNEHGTASVPLVVVR